MPLPVAHQMIEIVTAYLEERCLDDTGFDQADASSGSAHVATQALHRVGESGLARTIDGALGIHVTSGVGPHHDQIERPSRTGAPNRMPQQKKGRVEVDLHCRPPSAFIAVHEAAGKSGARTDDKKIWRAAKNLGRRLQHQGGCSGLEKIPGDPVDAASSSNCIFLQLPQASDVTTRRHDRGASASQRAHRSTSDAGRGAAH